MILTTGIKTTSVFQEYFSPPLSYSTARESESQLIICCLLQIYFLSRRAIAGKIIPNRINTIGVMMFEANWKIQP